MELNIVQVNSSLFTHNSAAKRLVTEISDIGVRNFQHLYDDAADVGIALRNPKTGNVTRWAVQDTVYSKCPDREILAWVLSPAPESVRKNPNLVGYTMTVFND